MKEKLYTIELIDAVKAKDECCFCWLERRLEQETLQFVLGSSYMEADIREQTSRQGFCRRHTKMMYDYGNTLGNAWILKSRLEHLRRQWKHHAEQAKEVNKPQRGWFGKRKTEPDSAAGVMWLREESSHCYFCDRMDAALLRMLDTWVHLIAENQEFAELFEQSPGLCLPHYERIWEHCEKTLKGEEKTRRLSMLQEVMEKNLDRIQEDIDWLIEKYDYRNRDADWKHSKDAVPRTMQKLTGGYPADAPFSARK